MRGQQVVVISRVLIVAAFWVSAWHTGAAPAAAATPWTDFNGDGFADLAIGAPRQDVDGKRGVGQVNVLYGSATGLRAAGDQRWTQSSPGIRGIADGDNDNEDDPIPGDAFGWAVATGDFDGDGFGDLATSSPWDLVNGVPGGAVNVIYGSSSGLTEGGDQLLSQANLPGDPVSWGRFGDRMAAGDFDGDGFGDLAISSLTSNDSNFREKVLVVFGTSSGLSVNRTTGMWPGTPAFPYPFNDTTGFGSALATGDSDGDGDDDLAIGAPLMRVDGELGAGVVFVVRGGPTGLDLGSVQLLSQDTEGVPGDPNGCLIVACTGDEFGSAVAFGAFDGDGYADLAIGVPQETASASHEGAVNVLYGSASGVTGDGAQHWSQGTPGVPGKAEAGDHLGAAVTTGDFDGDGHDDLAIGTPGEGISGMSATGAVTILRGSDGGVGASGAQLWTQNSPGVPGTAEHDDAFGGQIVAGNFGRSSREDLAIGVGSETVGGLAYAGVVDVIYGSSGGLTGTNAQSWWLNSPGIKGIAQRRGLFGFAIGS